MLTTADFLVTPLRTFLGFLSAALELTAFFPDETFNRLTRHQSPETDCETATQVCALDPGQHRLSDVTQEGAASKDIVFSIHPRHAEKILIGEKTVEVRRRFIDCVRPGVRALIYSTKPSQALIGAAEIRAVQRLPLKDIWERHGQAMCIEKKEFEAYFSGRKHGYAIFLAAAKPLERPLPLSELRERFGFEPPQSYLYASRHLSDLVENEQSQNPDRY